MRVVRSRSPRITCGADLHGPPPRLAPQADTAAPRRPDAPLLVTRRAALCTGLLVSLVTARPLSAATLEEVTPPVPPPAQLSPREQVVADVFDRCNPSVVNVFDLTLRSAPAGGHHAFSHHAGAQTHILHVFLFCADNKTVYPDAR
jgi:hypothetical protein